MKTLEHDLVLWWLFTATEAGCHGNISMIENLSGLTTLMMKFNN